ncbi:Carboxypeptidase S1-like protein A [Golovinomyces cichoracearum]|uniref:Carboxypeptidase n=1 Tax=Golovinomyces cichoracearum TaxID=62708 RepID=A0A420IKQ9_9PEZI|nr:Carboxypeptidase S1-like protein A [Golovinomyces cichoracearum]
MYKLIIIVLLAVTILSQYPPISHLNTIKSPIDDNITIKYKTPTRGTCQTVFDSQKQFTGWVNTLSDYASNTFFWFIEAREPTDQLVIWLNGGPGSSSMFGLFTENGPCEVIRTADGGFTTHPREWGWDRGANILYIDQPNQVGYSYDEPTNGSIDLLTLNMYSPPQTLPKSQSPSTFLNGTFSSLNKKNTANTTESAGIMIWHMLQGFISAFPQYSINDSVSIHLFTESYGGKYGPKFARLWEIQNEKRLSGQIPRDKTFEIKVLSLGIINGCVDDLVQAPYWPIMAVNNTLGLTTINPVRAKLALTSFYAPGGCKEQIQKCRATASSLDPLNLGNVNEVNSICSTAYTVCSEKIMSAYLDAGRSIYDIAHFLPQSFPSSTYFEYLNTDEVLTAIGSPVNFTQNSQQVINVFADTGDYERQAPIPDIAALLRSGVRVGFIYGDRDYICNWQGGEAISLAVAAETSQFYSSLFPVAGYAPIIVNSSYIGGVVRQYGNLSFSRIYDAGHSVPAYQPETAFQVFARIIRGKSLSTGKGINLSTFNTSGPPNATHTNTVPESPSATCYIRNIPETCTDDQKKTLVKKEGIIMNGIFYESMEDYNSTLPTRSSSPTDEGITTMTKTIVLTGFFTATNTPDSQKKSNGIKFKSSKVLLSIILLFILIS